MRTLFYAVVLLTALPLSPLRAQSILEVLERSQAARMAQLAPAADGARAAAVKASFARVAARVPGGPEVALQVVHGAIVAECVHGRTIVANESLADEPEAVRLFVLAHELGHAVLGHWQKMGALYAKYIPGEVIPQTTDAVAGELGREASALSHAHELEADRFAWHIVRSLGYDIDSVMAVFRLRGVQPDTATHPGTRKRVAHLRSLS